MVDFVRNLVAGIEELVVFIKKPSFISPYITNGALGFCFLVLSCLIGQRLQLLVMSKIIANIAGVYLCTTIYFGAFDRYFRAFSHRTYINGIIFLAGFTAVVLWRYVSFDIENFFTVVCVNLSIYSVCWFCYHIITEKILLKLIKVRVRLYLAIGGVFSYILLLAKADIWQVSVMIASFLVSFAWISYFIEAFELDKEKKEAL